MFKGLLGVCPKEERHLVVPADLAYGERGAGEVIPPNATLLFDIVVMDVEKVQNFVKKQKGYFCTKDYQKKPCEISSAKLRRTDFGRIRSITCSFKKPCVTTYTPNLSDLPTALN